MLTTDGKKVYRTGITFEHITSLYLFDKNIRNAMMAAMLDLEEHIKESVANVIASSFGTDPNEYLKFANYRDKKKNNKRFKLSSVLNTIKEEVFSDKNPIAHYRIEYGIVPPWILFKGIYFSTIVNFIDKFKPTERLKLVNLLYNSEELDLEEDSLIKLMSDTLSICVEYRNVAAHGGRIYNHNTKASLREELIFGKSLKTSGLGQLLFLLNMLHYPMPFRRLYSVLQQELTRHCNAYPEDVTYLSQILKMDIQPKTIVYISAKTHKYHSNSHCSGIKSPQEMDINDAIDMGYLPCKRCCNNNPVQENK